MPIQPKLSISTPGDQYEQEADGVADRVMRMPDPVLQRQCKVGCSDALVPSPNDEAPLIKRQVDTESGSSEIASDFTSRLGSGAPLDTAMAEGFDRYASGFALGY